MAVRARFCSLTAGIGNRKRNRDMISMTLFTYKFYPISIETIQVSKRNETNLCLQQVTGLELETTR